MKKLLHLKISGNVQGVFFRQMAKREAAKLELIGMAKNNNDGTVEIVAEGEEKSLYELLKWSQKGPELAKVEKVESVWEEPSGKFNNFQVM